tara:strand:+ start:57 stop:224 length:168 start_codon:yes stop_codon:yes gene_type:complete
MKLQIEIHNKEGLKDKDIYNLLDFLESINYDDVRNVLELAKIGWGNKFLTFKRVK